MYSLTSQNPETTAHLYFDTSPISRALSKAGIVICWLAGLVCLGLGIWLVRSRGGAYLDFNQYTKEIWPLGLNVLVTFVNETLGYVHTNSLRWALQREGRLTFNSNLRLFTSARTSKANAWYANACMLLCIVMAYASTSFIFMGDSLIGQRKDSFGHDVAYSLLPENHTTFVCGYALVTLAIGILGQCVVATVALLSSVSSPTWSSNPIDTAAACAGAGAITVVPGRCLRSVHDRKHGTLPVAPRCRQGPAYHAHPEVRIVFYSVWVTVALCLVWGLVLIAVIRNLKLVDGMYPGRSWAFFPTIPTSVDLRRAQWDGNNDQSGTMTIAIPWNVIGQFVWQNTSDPYVSFPSFCWAFALGCLLQAVMTLSLHCAELLVNVVRDEKTWRRAGSRSGGGNTARGLSRAPTNALHALFVSGPAMMLFIFKPILHWVFGLAVSTYFSVGLVMHPPQIVYLSIGAVVLASFVSACAFWQPKGPQPATFGHLQTLVDLIDEWPEIGETMFWGRKEGDAVKSGSKNTVKPDIRTQSEEVLEEDLVNKKSIAHAGTAAMMLEEVRFDEVYMSSWIRE